MANFFEELKAFLENTSDEEIDVTWSKYDTQENNIGPTVESFIFQTKKYGQYLYSVDSSENHNQKINNQNISPKFTSGFILNFKTYHGISSFCH